MLKELLDSPKCQFKLMVHYSNPQRFPQTSFQGARAPEFEPFAKNKSINPEKGKFETEIDKFNCEDVVTDTKIVDIKTSQTENENIRTLINETENEKEKANSNTVTTKTANEKFKPESREELNSNIENKSKTKNKQITKTKTKSKATPPTTQKFSNHIKFIDYIPTHELITYRHLFACGFYVE